MTWRREEGREGGRARRERARPAEGQGRHTPRAAPFSRGSPDVTVALFNYSHAYARRCYVQVENPTMRATHIRHPYQDLTYAPHYVLCVCPPTRRAITCSQETQEFLRVDKRATENLTCRFFFLVIVRS